MDSQQQNQELINLKKDLSTLVSICNKKDTELLKLTDKLTMLTRENDKLCIENEKLVKDTYDLTDIIDELTQQLNAYNKSYNND